MSEASTSGPQPREFLEFEYANGTREPVAYVRADVADRHKRERDRLLEAARLVAESAHFPNKDAEKGKWPIDRDIVSQQAVQACRVAIAKTKTDDP